MKKKEASTGIIYGIIFLAKVSCRRVYCFYIMIFCGSLSEQAVFSGRKNYVLMKEQASLRFTTHLRNERLRKSWTQQELADQLGTTKLTVGRWERGVTVPGPYFRLRLAALFGKSVEELGLVEVHASPPSPMQEIGSKTVQVPSPHRSTGSLDRAVSTQSPFYRARQPAGAA